MDVFSETGGNTLFNFNSFEQHNIATHNPQEKFTSDTRKEICTSEMKKTDITNGISCFIMSYMVKSVALAPYLTILSDNVGNTVVREYVSATNFFVLFRVATVNHYNSGLLPNTNFPALYCLYYAWKNGGLKVYRIIITKNTVLTHNIALTPAFAFNGNLNFTINGYYSNVNPFPGKNLFARIIKGYQPPPNINFLIDKCYEISNKQIGKL